MAEIWPLEPRRDAQVVYEFSRHIWEAGYPPAISYKAGELRQVFAYPPSAVMLFKALGLAGPQIFAVVWSILMFAGLNATLRVCLIGDRLEQNLSWLVVGGIALVVAGAPIEWDLRNANCNLIYLGLVLAGYATLRARPTLAGILIATSFSLKIYSALIVVWLLASGFRRAFIAASVTAFALWCVIPLLCLGPGGTLTLYSGWLDQLALISGDWVFSLPPHPANFPLVTLRASAMAATEAGPFAPETERVVIALLAIWVATLVWYGWRSRKLGVEVPSRAALADLTMLLLAPLPFSPWLEPYHAVPVVVGVAVCVLVTLDSDAKWPDRWTCLGLIAAFALDRLLSIPIAMKGFDIFGRMLLLGVVLTILRPRLSRSLLPSAAAWTRSTR